ncbi:phytoene desaturase family protein [Chloroflexota bacterium]
MTKSVIVIGAGIAGLSAGCYLQMNGYRTQIFELHDKPGGLCTSWKRKGYTIDGCIRWLLGARPGIDFYQFWEELGAVQGRTMIEHEEYMRIEGREGQAFVLYTDSDRLEKHMKELAPEDAEAIDELMKGAEITGKLDVSFMKAPEVQNLAEKAGPMLKMLPRLPFVMKWAKFPFGEYGKRFKNPFLREAFAVLTEDVAGMPALGLFNNIAWYGQGVTGYPVGGSLAFVRAIERRYLDLGGEIHYGDRVAKILVEADRAVGVRLEGAETGAGAEHRGDIVISAADGHATIFDMLGGKYLDDKIRGYYDELPLFQPLVHVALGVARTFDEVAPSIEGTKFPIDEPVTIGGLELTHLPVQIYSFDPTLAPEGKTLMRVMLTTDYQYWKDLSQDRDWYRAEKKQVAETVIAQLDRRYPGLAAQVEMCDVATPVTFERYTGNWQGNHQGWLPSTETFGLRMKKTLPGLTNFHMAGQWVEPGGGLPLAAVSGRYVAQIICKEDDHPFVTTFP